MTTTEHHPDTRAENLATLAKIFQDYAGVDAEEVVPEARIIDDLAINSLALVEITIRTEDAFGVRLEDQTMLGFDTVGDLLNHLDRHHGETTVAKK